MQPTTEEEALAWLKRQAMDAWGLEVTPELEPAFLKIARAMAAVSAAGVPDDVDPQLL